MSIIIRFKYYCSLADGENILFRLKNKLKKLFVHREDEIKLKSFILRYNAVRMDAQLIKRYYFNRQSLVDINYLAYGTYLAYHAVLLTKISLKKYLLYL